MLVIMFTFLFIPTDVTSAPTTHQHTFRGRKEKQKTKQLQALPRGNEHLSEQDAGGEGGKVLLHLP